MGTVDLPLLAADTPIAAALEELRAQQRAGIVTLREGEPTLVYISELRAAQRAGKGTVGEVEAGRPLVTTSRERSGFADAGFALTSLFSLYSGVPDVARVTTAHEYLAAALNAAFVCDGPEKHYFPEPEVNANDDCPECTTPASGKHPTVQRFV